LHDAHFYVEGLTLLSVGTSRVQADLCNLSNESMKQQVILYTSIVYSIAFFFVTFRIVGKAVTRRLAGDDVAVVLALLLTAVPLGCILRSTYKPRINHV
jgi:hypothetical protein